MKIRPALFGLCALTLGLHASPEGGRLIHGEASWKQEENCLQIKASDRAIIDWNHFGIKEGEIVQFLQDHAGAAVLNRDISGVRSDIFGTLTSVGKVYLVNKVGIFIGKEAVIDVGSFIGSSLDILNEDFVRGEELLFSDGGGLITNEGTIRSLQGEVYLIGHQVKERGTVEAGNIGVGVGYQVILKPEGTEKIYVRPAPNVSLQQLELGVPFHAYAIQQSGKIEATRSEIREGRIFLVGDVVETEGALKAPEGKVQLLGDRVQVSGVIDVSGPKGGTILVGGDFQGKNPEIHNAKIAIVTEDARLIANSTESGNGGKVILWSDYGTHFSGQIQAEGGPLGGDGGFVEVSGRMGLDYRGVVSTLATKGKTGTLLLDPSNISIDTVGDSNITQIGTTWTPTGCSAVLTPLSLTNSLALNNIIVTTTFGGCGEPGDITVKNDVIYNSGNSLTLLADHDIFAGAIIRNDGTGSITLTAANDVNVGFLASNTPATQQVYIGSVGGFLAGAITVNATAGSVNVGLTTGSFPAQIGYGDTALASAISGNITVQAQKDINLIAGTGAAGAYAQIGHGAPSITTQGITGSITVKSVFTSGNISLQGSTQELGYALIGHGGRDTGNVGGSVSGAIQVEAGSSIGSITVAAGASAGNGFNFAQIGHCGTGAFSNSQTVSGDISLNCQRKGGVALAVQGAAGPGCYAQIGHGGDGFRFEQDVSGSITATAIEGDVTFSAGNGEHAYAQMGHGGYSVTFDGSATGVINMSLNSGALSMIAAQDGTNTANLTENYVQIGHGGSRITQTSGTSALNGNITVNPVQKVSLQGADSTSNFAQIGHGGYSSEPNSAVGDISITGQVINLQALVGTKGEGNGGYAQIGHGGTDMWPAQSVAVVGPNSGVFSGNITVSGTSLTLDGGGALIFPNNNLKSPAQIGHGGAGMNLGPSPMLDLGATLTSASFTGDINVTASAGNIILIGGNARDEGGAWIGHGPIDSDNSTTTSISGLVNVNSSQGQISLTGGNTNAINVIAVIGNGLDHSTSNTTFTGNETVVALKDISIQGGQGVACFASIYAPSGTQAVTSTADMIRIKAGDGDQSHASIISLIGPQTVTASLDVLASGGTGGNVTYARVFNENPTPSSTTVTSQLGSVRFQNGITNTNYALLGWRQPGAPYGSSIAVNAARNIVMCYDLDVTAGVLSSIILTTDTDGNGLGSFAVDTGTYNAIGSPIAASSNGISFKTQGGPISIFATDLFASGASADFMIGDPTDVSLTPLMPVTIISVAGPITINHFRNIFVTTSNQGGLSTSGDVLLIADQNIQMTEQPGNPGRIKAKNATLVVDNYFPTYPGIGTGFFSMTANAQVNAVTKVFSARQPLNTILGTLNGFPFVAGTQFVDTSTERWGIYYPNSFFGGPNYTIFYKDGFVIPPIVPGGTPTIIDALPSIYQTQTGLSQMFFDLRAIDDKFYWISFLVSYDKAGYLAQKEEQLAVAKWVDRLQVYQKAYFWKWFLHGIPRIESLSSYEVEANHEDTLQPRVKGFMK